LFTTPTKIQVGKLARLRQEALVIGMERVEAVMGPESVVQEKPPFPLNG
jgi:hypothetical protein